MKRRWYEPKPRAYERTLRAECGRCPLAGPDIDGQFHLEPRDDCALHGARS